MRKTIAIAGLIFTLFIITACSEDRSFSIDDVTIDAQIDDEGIIHVRELYTYTFDGSYEGMTRSIDSDADHFKAYLTDDTDPTVSTKNLKALKVKKEDDDNKIYTDSKNETKKVLYSYDVKGSVKKYQDVGELEYTFFDTSNETDLHHTAITIHPPATTPDDQLEYFLHDDQSGKLTVSANGLLYENELLESGKNATIRMLFPADQLTEMKYDKQKEMKAGILAAEQELSDRRENLEANMNKAVPFIWILISAVIVAAIMLLVTHPNRYRGDKSEDGLLRILEQTDPLFVKYLYQGENLSNESFIAALFSLKQRGIVKMAEVPSEEEEGKHTFRFTRINTEKSLDKADSYLMKWLFTEKDEHGDYFLLESLTDNEKESEAVRKEKASDFEMHFSRWSQKVSEREDYQGLKHPYKGYSIFSIPLIILSYGLFYYFTKIDPISQTAQWVMPAVLGFLAVIALLFNRSKWVLPVYYVVAFFMTGMGLSTTNATILTLILYGIALLALLIIPVYFRDKELRKLNYAIKTARTLFKKGDYPIGSDPDKIERRIAYAVILDVGEDYGAQCGELEQGAQLKALYPLLNNPVYATTAFSTTNVALYVTVVQTSSTSTTTSSTGGGGAGAF